MNYRVVVMILIVLISSIFLVNRIQGQVEQQKVDQRDKRMNLIFDRLTLNKQEFKNIKTHINIVKPKFEQMLQIQQKFQTHFLDDEGATPEGAKRKYKRFLSDLENAQKNYSLALNTALEYLSNILSEGQLKSLYEYLYNELWYEGLIRKDKVATNQVQTVVMDTTVDMNAVLKGQTMEDLFQEMQTMLEMEGKSTKWQSKKFPPEPKPAPEQDGEFQDVQLEPQVQIAEPPPWQGMDLGPVTVDRIRALLEEKPQHILEFYWFDLMPRVEKLIDQRLVKNKE